MIDRQSGEHSAANIYFEGGPTAGDGHYLDHFLGTSKTWFRSVEQIEPQLIDTTDVHREKKRWLSAGLPGKAPRSVDCYGKFGVHAYGETKVLLHYYARRRNHADGYSIASLVDDLPGLCVDADGHRYGARSRR